MKKNSILILIPIVASFMFCNKQQTVQEIEGNLANNTQVKASPVSKKMKAGATILDVRTTGEFSGGHYKNAINIPIQELASRLKELGSKTKPVVVYCAAGFRAGKAKTLLESNGFKDVTNAGGLRDMP